MTLFEILNFNRELLERLARMGFKPDDYKYIDLYKEYEQMRRQDDKGLSKKSDSPFCYCLFR